MKAVFACALLTCVLSAQDGRLAVSFSNPSGAKKVRINTIKDPVEVKVHEANNVLIEHKDAGRQAKRSDGLREIPMAGRDLQVEERDNVIEIRAGAQSNGDLVVYVPRSTSITLRGTNGSATIDGVDGDVEADVTNGHLRLLRLTGGVVASSMNGGIDGSIARLRADKPLSFSSMNGTIEVSIPGDSKATVKMKTVNGKAFTDFEIASGSSFQPVEPGRRDAQGRYRLEPGRTSQGTINGGGVDISFTTMNGNIFLRKGQ